MKRRHWITASAAPLAARCAWWARADQDYERLDVAEDALGRGTVGHAKLEARLLGQGLGPRLPDRAADERLDDAVDRALDWLREGCVVPIAVERPIVYDAASGAARLLSRRGHRRYGQLGAHEVPGTADLVGRVGPEVVVVDWKFGQGFPDDYAYQLRLLGLAWARHLGAPSATLFAVCCHPASLDVAEWSLGPVQLEIERARWGAILAEAAGSTAEPHTGQHCRFCRAGGGAPEPFCPGYLAREASAGEVFVHVNRKASS